MTKKYSVFDAVWIATALMAKGMYDSNHVVSIGYYYFKQTDIIKVAQRLTDDKVDNARVSWWCCADAKKNVYNYLRAGSDIYKSARRLTMMDEFSEKTYPKGLDMSDKITMGDKSITLEELFVFVREVYPSIIKGQHSKETLASEMISETNSKLEYAKNVILYGPPGTGKTYSTVVYAVAIIENKTIEMVKTEPYEAVFDRYNKYKEEKQVAFTTFHQSYGYEEFIEGIKPVIGDASEGIGYTIEDGVFKEFCENTKFPKHKLVDHNAKIWKVVLQSGNHVSQNTVKFECFNEGKIMYDWKTREDHIGTYVSSQITHFQERVEIGDIVVTYAGAGTDIDAVGIVTGDAEYDEEKPSYRWSRTVEWLECNIVRNIKELNGNKYLDNDQLQHLKRVNISELLKLVEPQTFIPDDKNYVFIIDEINRGNISKIFGELITLIEETKREGMDEEAVAILPYSGKNFSVPANVYILGTMNTADRSIALMDTALRRRFEFVEMMPDAEVLRKIGADKVEDLDVALMLEKINERITFLYDREHTIGHAFFTKLAKNPTIDTLKSIFEKSVIPLLQEYFYEDYQKIQLVLGDNGKTDDAHKFILDRDVKVKDIFKGSVDDVIDLPEKRYTINSSAFSIIDSYKEII